MEHGARALGSTAARALSRVAWRSAGAGGAGRGAHAALPGSDLPGGPLWLSWRCADFPAARLLVHGAICLFYLAVCRYPAGPVTERVKMRVLSCGLLSYGAWLANTGGLSQPAAPDGPRHAAAGDADLRDARGRSWLFAAGGSGCPARRSDCCRCGPRARWWRRSRRAAATRRRSSSRWSAGSVLVTASSGLDVLGLHRGRLRQGRARARHAARRAVLARRGPHARDRGRGGACWRTR